jgi:xanthine dehydrogenase molybdopterin-binding subunit B
MGQGLLIKVAQVVAETFQIDIENIKITPINTAKVPNTSPTAASSGSDLNGMAALNAAEQIAELANLSWEKRRRLRAGQGLTSEEMVWDEAGRLRTHGPPSTYKIPGSRAVPPVFNVRLAAVDEIRARTINI